MDWIPLNIFQKVTRHWDSMHPYNAAQVMRLAAPVDRDRLARTWRETLADLGMGRIELRGQSYRWEPRQDGSPDAPLIDLPAGVSIDRWMTDELNHRFDEDSNQPFRAFVVEDGDSVLAGVVYHHWIADSFSIRMLLREWFYRAYAPELARRRPFLMPKTGYWGHFGPGKTGWSMGSSILSMIRWGTRFGKARRIDARRFAKFDTHFSSHRAPDGLIDEVAAAARRAGVTVNDVFLASMALVCHELVPLDKTPWRRDLVLGTIVDLRPGGPKSLAETFGLFLGFTSVFCKPEEFGDWKRLLSQIHHQIGVQKATHAADASMMRMVGSLGVIKLMKHESLLELYRKRFGMTAGISNVNLNRDWVARYHPQPLLEYLRVSPVGPLMPLVFTPTTLGTSLNVGLTCRSSVIPPEQAGALGARFIEHLSEFAKTC